MIPSTVPRSLLQWFYLLLSIASFTSIASEFTYLGPRVDLISQVNGKPLRNIQHIVRDDAGFFWLGGGDGLIRYDGYDIQQFQFDSNNANSLVDNFILDLLWDGQHIWIATANGLSRFNPATGQFTNFTEQTDNTNGLSSNIIYALAIGKNDALWLATHKGINRLDRKTLQITAEGENIPPQQVHNGQRIREIYEDSRQRLWFTIVSSGVYFYDLNNKTLKQFKPNPKDSQSLNSDHALVVYQTRDKSVYIGTDMSLYKYNELNQNFKHYQIDERTPGQRQRNIITDLFEDRHNRLWITTLFNGVSYLSPGEDKVHNISEDNQYPNSLNIKASFAVQESRDGTLLFSSDKVGLYQLNPDAMKLTHWQGVEKDTFISAMTTDRENNTWIGVNNHLYMIGPDSPKPAPVVNDIGHINAMTVNHDGTLILSVLGKGLFTYHQSSSKLTPHPANEELPSSLTGKLLLDQNQDLWLGLYSDRGVTGVHKFDHKKGRYTVSLPEYMINDMFEIEQGILLATRNKGLMLLKGAGDDYEATRITTKAIEFPTQIIQTNAQDVWISSNTDGLARLNLKTMNITFTTMEQGLPSNNIGSLIQDKQGKLWLGNRSSLIRFNPKNSKIEQITETDGLYSNFSFATGAVHLYNGDILYSNGVNLLQFPPTQLFKSTTTGNYKVLFSDFRLKNKTVPLNHSDPNAILTKNINDTNQLTLTHNDYLFSISLASDNLKAPLQTQFSYRLVGNHDDWIELDASNRTLSFTALPAGDYQLQVKAAGPDKHFGEGYRSLNISILPPWYLTNVAYSIYLALAIITLLLVIRLRTEKLQRQAKQLEQTVQQRTEELQQSRDQITALLSQKERHFANISHEFKTPLTLILSPLESLLSSPLQQLDPKQLLSKLAMMKRNGSRLLRMVEQMLELSRLDAKVEQNLRLYSLKKTLNSMLVSFQPLLDNKSLSLKINNFDDVLVHMQTDSLEMILTNLVSNAIKYTHEHGSITIEVQVQPQNVNISVQDSGIGIEEQHQANIFNRFTRVDDVHSENIPGAGIGLALVKELVESHQGTIALTSRLGYGSTFTLSLPLAQQQDHQPQELDDLSATSQLETDALNASSVEPTPTTNRTDEQQQTILVIDDNTDMLQLLSETIGERFNCICAAGGEKGLQLAKEMIPDLVISDIMMPGINGYEVARQLKSEELTCHIPLILLSAKGDIDSRMEGWKQDIDDYQHKPFHPQELLLRIDSLLSIRAILKKRFIELYQNQQHSETQAEPTISEKDLNFVQRFRQRIAENYQDSEFNRTVCAQMMNISERQLTRKLGALMQDGFSEQLRDFRLNKAVMLFKTGLQISQICDNVGFNNLSYFSRCFKAKFGKTPKQYQKEVILG